MHIDRDFLLNEIHNLQYGKYSAAGHGKEFGVLEELSRLVLSLPEAHEPTMCDIYVKDKMTGEIHRVGSDKHDSIWVEQNGHLHYHNLQNGDGASGAGDTTDNGYVFLPSDCGEMR